MRLGWEIVLFAMLALAAISVARAGQVRTLYVNSDSMAPIYLSLGESTILRFSEKPKKVVIGNQNYYNVEFVDNDVTIQPLGHVATNLFVYGENHTYGFLLNFGGHGYDDIVRVKWRGILPAQAQDPGRRQMPAVKEPHLMMALGHDFKVKVIRILGPTPQGVHVIDLDLENASKSAVPIKDVQISFLKSDGSKYSGEWATEKDVVPAAGHVHGRFIFKLEPSKFVNLEVDFTGQKVKTLIPKRFL